MADQKKDDEINRESGGQNAFAATTTLTADQLWEQATSGSTLHRMLTRAGIDSRTVFESAIGDDEVGGASAASSRSPSEKLAEILSLISDPTYSDDKDVLDKTPKAKLAEPGTVAEDWTPRSPQVLRRMKRDLIRRSQSKEVAEADPNLSDEGSAEISDVDEDLAPAEMVEDDDEQYAGDDENTLSAQDDDDERVPPKKAPSVMKTRDQPKPLLSALDLLTHVEKRRGRSSDRIVLEPPSAHAIPPATESINPVHPTKKNAHLSQSMPGINHHKQPIEQITNLAENARAPSGFQDNTDRTTNDDRSTTSSKKRVTILEDGKVTSTRDSVSAISEKAKTKHPTTASSQNASTAEEFDLEVYQNTQDVQTNSGDEADDEREDLFKNQTSYRDTDDTIWSIPTLPDGSATVPPTASTIRQMSSTTSIALSAPKSILKITSSHSEVSSLMSLAVKQQEAVAGGQAEVLEYHGVRNVSGQQTGHTFSEKEDDTVTAEEFEASKRASEKRKQSEAAKILADEEAIKKEQEKSRASNDPGKRHDADDDETACDDPACKLLTEDEELQKLNKEYKDLEEKLKEARKERIELLTQVEHMGPLKKTIEGFISLPAVEEAVCLADTLSAAVTEAGSMAMHAVDTLLLCKPGDKSKKASKDGSLVEEVMDGDEQ